MRVVGDWGVAVLGNEVEVEEVQRMGMWLLFL